MSITNLPSPASFSFENNEVRTIVREGEPWFVASDVAKALGYTNPTKAVQDHCNYVKSLSPNESLGLTGQGNSVKIIPEADVYALIFGSKLPNAAKFRDWVFTEVLPAIRKTGKFAIKPEPIDLKPYPVLVETLTTESKRRLVTIVDAMLADIPHIHYQRTRSKIWAALREYFHVTRYEYIPEHRMSEAIAFLSNVKIKGCGLLDVSHATSYAQNILPDTVSNIPDEKMSPEKVLAVLQTMVEKGKTLIERLAPGSGLPQSI